MNGGTEERADVSTASESGEASSAAPAAEPPPVDEPSPPPEPGSADADASADPVADVAHGTPVDPLEKLLDVALSSDPFHSADLVPIAHQLLQQLAPQDPAEQMLVTQMIATFTRSMFLTRHANRQKNARWFALYSGECDRAMNLYRKQMAALADYRRPRRTVFNAIRTANIAGQQVVMTGRRSPKKSKPHHAPPRPSQAKAKPHLPPVPPRPGRTTTVDPRR